MSKPRKNPHQKSQPLKEGQIFKTNSGPAVVLEYRNARQVRIRFTSTGTEKLTSSYLLRAGRVRDQLAPSVYGVGFCSGSGYRNGGKYTNAGRKWVLMMARCYDPNNKRLPYSNVTVAPEWHDYSNYEIWHNSQNFDIEGLELDKDLLPFLRGENDQKIYSESTCTFLSHELNLALAQLQRRLKQAQNYWSHACTNKRLPTGLRYDVTHRNFRISISGKTVAVRKNILAAFEAYKRLNIASFIEKLAIERDRLAPNVVVELEKFQREYGFV